MNLHRIGKEHEWSNTPEAERNIFQKVAAKTRGIVTPGNAVSLIGLGLVVSGLRDVSNGNTLKGTIKMGIGRFCDNADGAVAHATKTKSPVGEALDIVIDKVVIAATVPVLDRKKILTDTATNYLLGQNIANTAATIAAKARGAEIHSSKEGKMNTFGQSFVLGMSLFAAAARENDAHAAARAFELARDAGLIVTAALGTQALGGYIQDAFASEQAIEAAIHTEIAPEPLAA